jgi:hypothetical protein
VGDLRSTVSSASETLAERVLAEREVSTVEVVV